MFVEANEDVTIRQLAERCEDDIIKAAARSLCVDVAELTGEEGEELLNGAISPATHQLVRLLNAKAACSDDKEARSQLVETARRALVLRGGYAALVNSPIGNPYEEDQLTSDLNYLTLSKLVKELHQLGLGPPTFGEETEDTPTFPVTGLLWSYHMQPMFTLSVRDRNSRKYHRFPFMFDTGGQTTTMCAKAWAILFPEKGEDYWKKQADDDFFYTWLVIQGKDARVSVSRGACSETNMIGCHFADSAGLALIAAYKEKGSCKILTTDDACLDHMPTFR